LWKEKNGSETEVGGTNHYSSSRSTTDDKERSSNETEDKLSRIKRRPQKKESSVKKGKRTDQTRITNFIGRAMLA